MALLGKGIRLVFLIRHLYDVLPRYPALPDRLAYSFLVFINCSGIQTAVADLQSDLNGPLSFQSWLQLEDTKAKPGDFYAVVRRHTVCQAFGYDLLLVWKVDLKRYR